MICHIFQVLGGEKEGGLRMKKQMDRLKVSTFENWSGCMLVQIRVQILSQKVGFDLSFAAQVQMSQSLNRTEKSVALSTELLKLGK